MGLYIKYKINQINSGKILRVDIRTFYAYTISTHTPSNTVGLYKL